METPHDTCPSKTFIRNLLNETDLPREIQFKFTKKDGVLRVELNDNHDEHYQY